MFRILASRLSVAILIGLLAGCGSTDGRSHTVPVKGTITYKGEPLKIGSIVFVPEAGGKTAMANITRDGEYVLGSYEETDGAIPGKHKIMIIALTSPGGSGLPEDVIKPDQAPVSVIPERFADQNKSKLVAEVKDGENTINFVLDDKTGEVQYN